MSVEDIIKICIKIEKETVKFNIPVEISYRKMRFIVGNEYEYLVTFKDSKLKGKISGTSTIERVAREKFCENFINFYTSLSNLREV